MAAERKRGRMVNGMMMHSAARAHHDHDHCGDEDDVLEFAALLVLGFVAGSTSRACTGRLG